jgi:uncharacterized protein (TIRG00374 family)
MTEVNLSSSPAGIDGTPPRNWKRFIIRIGGSGLVLALLFLLLPREQLIEALSGFSIDIWLAGISTYLCLHLIGVAKWRMLVNSAGAGLSFAQAARCYYYGLFGNTFLPSVVGGDILRAGLAIKTGHSKSAVLMGSVVDRSIDGIGLALVAGIGALLIPTALNEHSRSIFWGFALVVATAGAGLLILLLLLPARRFPFRIRRALVKVRRAARLLLKRPGRMFVALISVMVLQTSQVVMNLWLGRLAMIQNATFAMWLFVWPLAKLAAMVPLTQGGIGLREAAQGVLFVPFGVSIEKAVATGLIFQAIVISGNLIGGLLAVLIGRFAPSAEITTGVDALASRSAHQRGVLGALILGGALFFITNTLVIAIGTGSAGEDWVNWMKPLPGLSASLAGSCVGFFYGAVPGYLLGRLAAKRI